MIREDNLTLYLFNCFSFSDQNSFESFQMYMSQEKGRLFSINLEHQNFGKNFTIGQFMVF